jgi:ankyrin repeat protein
MNNLIKRIEQLVIRNNIDEVKLLVSATNINTLELRTERLYNVLIMFIVYSRCTIEDIDYLINIGIDINTVDSDNETALFAAVRYDKVSIVLHLLQLGCVVSTVSTRIYGSEIDAAITYEGQKSNEMTWILYSYGARPLEKNVDQMNELIGPYIRCSLVAYLLIGIRKFRRSPLSQHPKEIILMIASQILKSKNNLKWTV